jgi:hypothetical protein
MLARPSRTAHPTTTHRYATKEAVWPSKGGTN